VFDVLFRSGNVHDSNRAREFIEQCLRFLKEAMPWVIIEARMDSAFFSDDIVTFLKKQGVEFSLSVPFERFAELKHMIQERKRWKRMDERWSWFETLWKPQKWDRCCRFLLIRQRVPLVFQAPGIMGGKSPAPTQSDLSACGQAQAGRATKDPRIQHRLFPPGHRPLWAGGRIPAPRV
jgi:hypothetical protein